MSDAALALAFVEASRGHLIEEYPPKIDRCLGELGEDGVWWRPNPQSNSVANLVLHICGNARQWIESGILGRPDVRRRDEEFATEGGVSVAGLRAHLEREMQTLGGALRELATACERTPELLGESRTIQGIEVTVLGALYHVVEHAAQHTGQIIYIAKLRAAKDLRFWVVESGTARPNW